MPRWLSVVLALPIAAACYRPTPPEGVACSPAGECPSGLQCVGGECRSMPGDLDAPPEPDAPLGCEPPNLGEFGDPVVETALSSAGFDGTPSLTADLLEVYFKSDRASAEGVQDIWVARRSAPDADWGMPVLVDEVNSLEADESPEVSADGLTLWLTSRRTGNRDLYVATRRTRTDPWSAPVRIPELSSAGNDEGLFVAPSQLVAYLHSDRGRVAGDMRLYRATRPALDAPWGTPVELPELSGDVVSENPWVTPDDCTMYFHRGNGSAQSIVFSTRGANGRFGPPTVLVSLEHPGIDADPWLTPDQRTILYAAEPAMGLGSLDILRATR